MLMPLLFGLLWSSSLPSSCPPTFPLVHFPAAMSDENPAQQPNNDDGKAPEAAASEHLNLKVKSQDGNEVYFKVT